MVADPHILHMVTPLKHMSPFDVNMALDAGYDAAIPYTQVTLAETQGLVQDAIFSRAPHMGVRTGLFIAGKNATLALDMLQTARESLVPPFELSIFADPAGSFTTAAAMVAVVEKVLAKEFSRDWMGTSVAIFGATGVVGFSAAVIAALEGASVTLVGHDGVTRVQAAADEIAARFGVKVLAADGSTEERKAAIASEAEVVFSAAAAGVEVLSADMVRASDDLLVAADVNAVPPAGIAGLGIADNGVPIDGTNVLGVGPLAIGDIKYKTQAGLFRRMIEAEAVVAFDFRDAFALARTLVA